MEFRGKYDFLSNMYPCEITDSFGLKYSCVEAAYQAAKTSELNERHKFTRMSGPVAKKNGRKLKLDSDWEQKKVDIMTDLVTQKFSNPELMNKLLAITDEIVEDNSWNDKFWGCYKGKGKNVLGKILMNIRDSKLNDPPTLEEGMLPGHIVITSLSDLKTAINNIPEIDEAWFVVRSLKALNGELPKLNGVWSYWVNQLSPSDGLFRTYWDLKQQGQWNHDTFMNLYVPQFLEEMRTDFAKKYLNILYNHVQNKKKTVALVCFCKDEAECHRSILAGLMQGVGITVVNEKNEKINYSLYNDMYRNGTKPIQSEPKQKPVIEQEESAPDPVVEEPSSNPELTQEEQVQETPETPIVVEKPKFHMLVAGSRTFHNAIIMEDVLNYLLTNKAKTHDIVIIEGGARGADSLAREYAQNHGYEVKEFPAKWIVDGKKDKAAGFKRNREMHEFLKDQSERGCVCFWNGVSTGTADNFKLCKEFNTPLRVYDFEQKTFID